MEALIDLSKCTVCDLDSCREMSNIIAVEIMPLLLKRSIILVLVSLLLKDLLMYSGVKRLWGLLERGMLDNICTAY